ncbi:MAG: bifunctional diaminohydroxyphosphoribosylaminopyrimidine deaminase/5-amino-6-(5-phosphoribosylamino)uracil reductase RibD [Myxococcota bacterium]|nr:bifunctional diaminohydroxyphosphoribosylaminopyrimidine deaminase/5-amino-6-(5-phosphoribosylamino)uracil reductase RibD [Myxococcota bacterium]
MKGSELLESRMRLALQSARRGMGRTHPNPSVGAVVWKGAEVLGRGVTRPPGGPHAEVVALEAAARRHGSRALRGASMAVTLEPCCFHGRTAPCTSAILEAGIRRVYVGCRDPHSRVSGRGIARLRRAGIKVEVGLGEAACREHHRGFFSVCERGRPHVSLKLASTLDARIATRTGESRWITGPEARDFVHGMRARADGILVGSSTALADDPALTARRGDRVVGRPVRILLDSRLRVPAAARFYDPGDGARRLVLTRSAARGRRKVAATGAELLDLPGRAGALDLGAGMKALADAGLTTVLVEGGGGLAAALLRENLVDDIHWIVAPRLMGADGIPALGELGVKSLSNAPGLEWVATRRLGADIHIHARPVAGRGDRKP